MNRHQQILLKNSLYKSIKADECVDFDPNWIETGGILKCIKPLSQEDNAENDLYFYHSDHIGSSSFITDNSGIVCQHLQYLPFGELFVEQRSTANYYTPYKFSGKEKDEETSYSYFGARYYLSDISVWASVDPMRDKYPYQSPYTYCGWSPVKIIDPNGTSEIVVLTGDENAKQETKNQMNRGFSEGFKVDYDKNGKMNYQGTAQTKEEKDLVTAIDDPNRQVSLRCTYDNFVSEPYSDITVELTVGAYFGNSQYEDFTSAFQAYNPEQANIFEANGGCPTSVSSVHEILEAYTGMIDSPNINLESSKEFDFKNAQRSAHNIVANRSAQFRIYQNEGSRLRNSNDPRGTTYINGKLIDIHGQNKKSKN